MLGQVVVVPVHLRHSVEDWHLKWMDQVSGKWIHPGWFRLLLVPHHYLLWKMKKTLLSPRAHSELLPMEGGERERGRERGKREGGGFIIEK